MCGFFGINQVLNDEKITFSNFFNQKRGPDKTNLIKEKEWTFIHNLLSITGDFTTQPFIDGQIYCLFNGEIYNFENFGDFKTDGECIIPLYKENGINFSEKLDGEFSIVIVDLEKDLITFSTDLFSTKPLWISLDDKIAFSSYSSNLSRLNIKNYIKVPANKTFQLSINDKKIVNKKQTFSLDLNQHKENYNDWIKAFDESIFKRTRTNKNYFIGLSSGYDSGCIAASLLKNERKFFSYSIKADENQTILNNRVALLNNNGINAKLFHLSKDDFLKSLSHVKNDCEEHIYKIKRGFLITPNEFMSDDQGSVGLSFICSEAKKDGCLIYLSGQGADEIFSDYGFMGHDFFGQSDIKGYYKENLKEYFPWTNFYEGTQYSYLGKEENVSGGHGMEGRYPFLDKKVVQEFLWLKPELKNKNYKSVLHEYLQQSNFPYQKDQKLGFCASKNLK